MVTDSQVDDPRPRVALLATTYFAMSHADVLGTRLIGGYWWQGEWTQPRVRVVSMYLEQDGDHQGAAPRPDIGRQIAAQHGVEVFGSIGEALTCGGSDLAVDGVAIIAEHGDYEHNEYGQQLYPRRRFFDAAVAAMVTAGRTIPIFNDKHLSHSFDDATAMYDTARRLGVPMLAGSTVPLAWRIPQGSVWPLGEPMTRAVFVGYGPAERYGIHNLEGLQSAVERRRGPTGGAGETGIVSVRGLSGQAAYEAVRDGSVDGEMLDAALANCGLADEEIDRAKDDVTEIILLTYADGLTAAVVNLGRHIRTFAVACAGPEHRLTYQIHLDPRPHRHWINFARQIESLMINRREPYPVERTLLTTGVLDAAMRSRHRHGEVRDTPELAISYVPADTVPETRVDEPLPPAAKLRDTFLSHTEED